MQFLGLNSFYLNRVTPIYNIESTIFSPKRLLGTKNVPFDTLFWPTEKIRFGSNVEQFILTMILSNVLSMNVSIPLISSVSTSSQTVGVQFLLQY